MTTQHNKFNLMFHDAIQGDEDRSEATEHKTRVIDQLGNIKIRHGSAGSSGARDEP